LGSTLSHEHIKSTSAIIITIIVTTLSQKPDFAIVKLICSRLFLAVVAVIRAVIAKINDMNPRMTPDIPSELANGPGEDSTAPANIPCEDLVEIAKKANPINIANEAVQ
jgi:hypothetical protein